MKIKITFLCQCLHTCVDVAEKMSEALTAKDAQIVALREALQAYEEALCDGPENCTYLRHESVSEKAKEALSAPPPASEAFDPVSAGSAAFEAWLRTTCFQEPTPGAYDLAKCAWEESAKRCAKHPLP